MVKWIGTLIFILMSLPIAIGIVDLWWFVIFNKMLILDHWTSQTFTGALILAACGLVAKVSTIWISDK